MQGDDQRGGGEATFNTVQQASMRSSSTKCMPIYRKEITHHVFPRAKNLKLFVLALSQLYVLTPKRAMWQLYFFSSLQKLCVEWGAPTPAGT